MIVCRTGTPDDQRELLTAALRRMAREEPSRTHLRAVMNAEDFAPFTGDAMTAIRSLARDARDLEMGRPSRPPASRG